MGPSPEHLIAAADIGTSKIAIVVAERSESGAVTCIDSVVAPMHGMREGVVVDIRAASGALAAAFETVEERLGLHLASATFNISGQHIRSRLAYGKWPTNGREITDDDVERATLDARHRLDVDDSREIIHEIPRAYLVDGQRGIRDPRGLSGYQVEAEVHYTTGAAATITNLERAIRGAGLSPEMFVASPLASGEALRAHIGDDECIIVVDIGAETLGVASYVDGVPWSAYALATGGEDIVRDLARQLHLPPEIAAALLYESGSCSENAASEAEFDLVTLPGARDGNILVPRSDMTTVIRQRAERFGAAISPAVNDLRNAGYEPDALLLVGGTAALDGLDRLLSQIYTLPVHRGLPDSLQNLAPELALPALTAAGLVLWHARYKPPANNEPVAGPGGFFSGVRRLFKHKRSTYAGV